MTFNNEVDEKVVERCKELTREEKIEFILGQVEIGSKAFNNSILDLMNGAGLFDGNPVWDFLGRMSKLWEATFDTGYSAEKAAAEIKKNINKTPDKILAQMCYAAHTMHTY